MDQSNNPYYVPNVAEADPAARYPPKLASALARMKEVPCPGATHWVYVLAYARRGVFYIDVARSHKEIFTFCLDNQNEQQRTLGKRQWKPLRLVLSEAFVSDTDARRRCAELRAMPHAWQCRMVDEGQPGMAGPGSAHHRVSVGMLRAGGRARPVFGDVISGIRRLNR